MDIMEEDLDLLFSPSAWGGRFSSPTEHIQHHLDFVHTASKSVDIPNELISYGESDRQKIHILGTDLPNDAPTFVFIHGGYWQANELRPESYLFIANPMHKNGIKTMFIGYDLCPHVTLDEICGQIEFAARKCIEYADKMQSKGLYFSGHSAGGHLVAVTGALLQSLDETDQNLVKGLIPIGGVFDLTRLINTYVNNPLNLDKDSAVKLSPMNFHYSFRTKIQVVVVVGANDSPEFIRQSMKFNEKLNSIESNLSTFKKIDNADHFSIIEHLADENFALTKFIITFING